MLKKTALVIDDEQPIISIVKAVLEDAGYTVYGASSGIKGLHTARKIQPDVIILDRHMPNMDGNEVLQELKENAATRNIPVMMLTGESKIDEVKSSIQFGASGYIIKPFKSDHFVKKLTAMVEK